MGRIVKVADMPITDKDIINSAHLHSRDSSLEIMAKAVQG